MNTIIKETLDLLPGGLLITDLDSRVLYASAALERRTGFAVAEIVGKKPGELWGGRMRKQFYATLWHTISGECQPFVGEVANTRKNGAKHDEHIYILPIRDGGGITRYFAEVHPELTSRESELSFAHEFLSRTKGQSQDAQFFDWLFTRLARREKGESRSLPALSTDTHIDPATFLYQSLILPTEQLYARRRDDALLIARAKEDPEQFSALYKKYAPSLREYFLKRLSGERVLAEDLLQETFLRAFRYLPTFRSANASYYTYLLRVAHSVLVNQFRKERYETVALTGNEEELVVEEGRVWPDLETLLLNLSPLEREIMLMKYRDGLKVRAIATEVGKSENAVKLILSRTRKKLRVRS